MISDLRFRFQLSDFTISDCYLGNSEVHQAKHMNLLRELLFPLDRRGRRLYRRRHPHPYHR